MSNVETAPAELTCTDGAKTAEVQVLAAREVPLGGPRAITVRRTLPQRARSLVGAWCFADHYGPAAARMVVPPHPHTGLQTVSWLFDGEIEHRDSGGRQCLVRPGELNLMTGGHGICHSEVSTERSAALHGVQLWVALPAAHRDAPQDLRHHVPEPVPLDGATARVFLGSLAGSVSPVPTFTPLLGAELLLEPGARLELPVDVGFEHGVLVDRGSVTVAGTTVPSAAMGYLAPERRAVELRNSGSQPASALLLGGPPFGEQIVMWWNFVGRSHEEIVAFRDAWQAESDRFGRVDGYAGDPLRLPAPELPNAVIKPRRNPGA
ncbi:MAG: pirin family protein [Thermocrispum sp.]